MRTDKTKLWLVILLVLLILSVGYIIFDKVQQKRLAEFQDIYKQGYSQGLNDAVISLYQQTSNCQQTTINIGNVTRQVMDASCLTQG